MIVEPKVRGFICMTAHPEGCRAGVDVQIEYVKSKGTFEGPKKVLVVGASMGYGLASRIAAAFGSGAATVGIVFDKAARGSRTATAGWYNTAAFENAAAKEGLYAKTINGDAFSREIKEQTIALIKKDLGKVDMVIYSLAAPRRIVVENGESIAYTSALKTIGAPYTNKTIDLKDRTLKEITIEPATEEEITATVKVMGGEDWKEWIDALKEADAIEDNAITLAYSYIGPKVTHPMYTAGTIGQAKKHLAQTAVQITEDTESPRVKAYISVNKALVTQSSSAIPVVPLYTSLLFRVMKEKGLHEGCIEQMDRMFREKIYAGPVVVDDENQIRLDDWEMREDVQAQIAAEWDLITEETLDAMLDIDGYWNDFYQLFGFGHKTVDYTADQETMVAIPSLEV